MKNIIYLLTAIILFSCNNSDSAIDKKNASDKVAKNALERFEGKPPFDNPIMVALLNSTEKDLNKVDKIYRDNISKSISTDYHENLKQYGITLLVENGLIENGSINQKEFYIKEQVSSTSNMPHIGTFYSLINAKDLTFSKEDLSKLEMEFYTKNLTFINSIDWSLDKEGKKLKINLLNFNHKMFVKNQSTL